MEMGWRWDFTYEILPQMAIATLNTILAAGVGYAIALIVGLFFLTSITSTIGELISRLSLSKTTRSPYCLVTSSNLTIISSVLFLAITYFLIFP